MERWRDRFGCTTPATRLAVLRLVLWCQQDADLGARLPALATYSGHVSLNSSQRYLQVTPDLVGRSRDAMPLRFGYLITDGRPA